MVRRNCVLALMDMDYIHIIQTLFSVFVSLGVGASTIAVSQFLFAMRDKQVDQSERSMLGVVYFVLRIAMGGILATALLLTALNAAPFMVPLGTFAIASFAMLAILYGNAIAMTMHWIPLRIAPAFQAGAWYTLGISNAVRAAGVPMSPVAYVLMYVVLFTVFLAAITFFMKRCMKS
jgi:peptidoglycan/LPS O-acetylase OafA/YrhL